MSENLELLVQRFLDGELDRRERGVLLRRLGSDRDLRERLLDDEQTLEAAANLARFPVPADFVARTMARLPAEQTPEADAPMARPARGVMQWLPAAAAAACLILAAGFWLGRTSAPRAEQIELAATPAVESQEIRVRLVLVEPTARSVAIVGDFNGWDPMRSPLERVQTGVWSTTLDLPPGRYNYLFLVDGDQWVVDPAAVETSVDGFGARNSVLDLGV